jgi:hypothetical protein
MARRGLFLAQKKIMPFVGKYRAQHRLLGARFQMVRLPLAVAVLAGAIVAAQASVPKTSAPNRAAPSDLDQTYLLFFEAGKASLTPQARQILRVAALRAHSMPQVAVRVMVPTEANSVTVLAQNRARAVKAELVRDGVKSRSIGNADRPEDPTYSNSDPIARAWLDRSAIVKISPLPMADSDRQV